MTGYKRRVERGFESLAGHLCRHRWPAIFAVLLAVAAAASGLRGVVIDTSTESFLHEDDPVQARYDAFREQFGRDDVVIVAVEPDTLFSPGALHRLRALHEALVENVPHVAAVNSMVNARSTRGERDRLVVGDLLETWPETEADFAALRERVLANPLYRNRLISGDGRVTTIAIELARFADTGGTSVEDALELFDESEPAEPAPPPLGDEETHLTVAAIQRVVADHEGDGFALRVAGTPAVTDALKTALQDDMRRFIGLAVAMIALLLYIAFRTVAAVVLPLAVALLALLSTVGLMGHFGTAITLPTVMLPSFLVAVSVGGAVHLLSIHSQRIRAGAGRREAIIASMGHAGLPIALTSLTTAVGLGSFAAAQVAPIADLGQFAAIGVLIALVFTLTLVPAGLAAMPRGRKPPGRVRSHAGRMLDDALIAIARWGVARAGPITGVSFAVAAGSIFLAAQLHFSHDVLAWLPDDWPVHEATRAIDRDLGGSVSLEVVLDTGEEYGLHDRGTLLELDTLAREIASEAPEPVTVGATLSVADLLKEIHQALNENRPEYHRIPENERLIPQEFLLFENSGSDDLEDLVDTGFRVARFSLRVPWRDTLAYPPFIRDVEERFRSALGAEKVVTITGVMSLLSRTLEAAIHSAAQSYFIAFSVITLMMIALIGRLGTGLISMIPNLAPIALTLALMQLAGIPLNLFTMLVGSIAIGLAVDDTIHFMHHFHRNFERTGDIEESVRRTLLTSGRAMLTTSVILSAGFFLFCLASMNNVIDFGLLTGVTILTALTADFVLAPALMALRYRRVAGTRAAEPAGVAE